ncbi:TetR/AcrR family transcriptional regulator [Bradyrhizobium canariense]|uniref:Transcriptional regulator, TetR family n=1 Tax=Bradyrhizobium canariense TaxID=255045 RepID=A0A1H1TD50_9BRAD|nr:TetR/AcrR family transcriptional regulator [Bradyrhizobium canariense]SDS57499.1 transcriptional regulator, TetR family [Bradyrhizobium canariense]
MSTFETSPHVLRPQQQRSRVALAKIVTAAEQLLRTRGIDGFSMAEVAEAARLPVGNIYRRFRGKDELLQAIKYDVTARIEDAVARRLSSREFKDITDLIQRFAGATCDTFAGDEKLYRTLFAAQVAGSAMDRIGADGRRRIFGRYREALLPFLQGVAQDKAERMARVSFHIITAAILAKARGSDETLNDLSWKSLGDEFGYAAFAYLQANLESVPKRP